MKPGKLIKKQEDRAAGKSGDNLNGSGDGIRDRIAETAYELYEQRGREDGHDVEDWIKAETIVNSQAVH